MSYNFRAGQYERPFAPKSLRNWEVPRWFPSKPRTPPAGPDYFLADSHGRLLPRAPRNGAPAWKHYPTAWDYPDRITREQAAELSKEPPPGRYLQWLPKSPKSGVVQNPGLLDVTKPQTPEVNQGNGAEYQPGCLTDPKKRIDIPPLFAEEKSLEELTDEIEIKEESLEGEKQTGRNIIMQEKIYKYKQLDKKRKENKPLPAVEPITGFHYARKMHMDNLLHQPLPDCLVVKSTRKNLKELCQDIDIKPYSSGWNGLFSETNRPLTSGAMEKNNQNLEKLILIRPATSGAENDICMKNATAMDLAIRWEYRTKDPRDEPKRSKHIDGSNGSKAPAVFSMVHSPKQDVILETGRSNAIFTYNVPPEDSECGRVVPCFDKDMSKNKRKEACEVSKCKQHSQYEKQRSPSVDHNIKAKESKNQSEKKEPRAQSEKRIKSGSCDGINGCGTSDGQSSRSSRQLRNGGSVQNHRPVKKAWTTEQCSNKTDLKENTPNDLVIYKNNKKNHRNQRILDEFNNNGSSIESFKKNQVCHSSSKTSKVSSNTSKEESTLGGSREYSKYVVKNTTNIRDCVACNEKITNLDKYHNANDYKKPEYKMAFKAGNPNSVGSSDCKNGENSSNNTKNSFKIPKMRDPYSNKCYAVPTLHPPFNRWRDTTGYPEHWRLASIYQHAYKHPEARRHPLLPAVYQ